MMKKLALITIGILISLTASSQFRREFDRNREAREYIINAWNVDNIKYDVAYIPFKYTTVYRDTVTEMWGDDNDFYESDGYIKYVDDFSFIQEKFKSKKQYKVITSYVGTIHFRVYKLPKDSEYSEIILMSDWSDFRELFSHTILKKGKNYEKHVYYNN